MPDKKPRASWYTKAAIERAKKKRGITPVMKSIGLKPGPIAKHYIEQKTMIDKLKRLTK